MSEDNKAATRRVIEEGFNEGDMDAVEAVVGEGFVGHDPVDPEDTIGITGVKARIDLYRGAFPDLTIGIEEIVAEGDVVATRWVARGTHDGELMGIPPTGNATETHGMTIDRYESGKLVESWACWNALGLMQQIGALPTPEAATT